MKAAVDPDPFGLDELPVTATKVELVGTPRQKELTLQASAEPGIQAIEDEIFREAGTVVRDGLSALDIDPQTGKEDGDWDEELGARKAARRRRTAMLALQPTKDAPYALKMAEAAYKSISRTKALRKGGERVLNLQVVHMPAVHVHFPELDVGEE